MKKWDKDDYHKEKENYINKEKKKMKEVLVIVKTITDIDMQGIKELKKITLYMAYLCCAK